MNGPRNLILATMFVILAAGFSTASDIYIAQNAAGGNTGADCADAHAAAWFNSSSNWGSAAGLIGPGTTAHLCGIITTELSFHGSGTSGNVLALLFETGARIQITPGMDSNGIINLGSNSYILIDGGASRPCGWNTATNTSEGSCNGQIENMLYGSSDGVCPAGTCTTQYAATSNNMINGTGGNVEIRNLQIGPAYVHTSTGNGGNDAGGTGCVGDNGGSSWNIHDNKLHDGLWCLNIEFGSGTTSNIVVSNNELYNNSHMLAVDGTATINGFTLSGNYLHDMYNWDTASDYDHGDAIHFFTSSGIGTIQNVAIYNNIFGGNTGGDITGQIFNEVATTYTNFVMFNNLFIMSTLPNLGAAGHVWGPAQCNSGCYFLNNTIARQTVTGGNLDLGYSTYAMAATVENNVNQGASWLSTVSASSPSLTLDYNAYGPFGNGWQYHGSSYGTFASWQSVASEGAHSFYNSSLNLDGTFKPAPGSPLIGTAVNVCTQNPNFCTNYPAIKNDITGNVRPTSGTWDIGAYQESTNGTAPAPPTGLAAVVH